MSLHGDRRDIQHGMRYRYPWVHSVIVEAAVELAITTERAGDKGWIAFAAELRATAQGATEEEAKKKEESEEAKKNLRALLERYPDLLDELRHAADRRVELIRL